MLETSDLDKVKSCTGKHAYTVRAVDVEADTVRLLTVPRGSSIESVCDAYARLTGEGDLHFVFAVRQAETKVAARATNHAIAVALDSGAEDTAGVAGY